MIQLLKTTGFCLLAAATACLVAVTFLPFLDTRWWLIRLMDFPRVLFGMGLMLAILAALPFLRRFRWATLVLLAVAAIGLGANVLVLWPYRPHGTVAASCPDDHILTVMIANVELGNRHSEALIQAVSREKPDLFLAMETDDWWDRALQPIRTEMPHEVKRITGSYYGIHFFSRLPLVDPEIRIFAGRDTPSVVTGVTLRDGKNIKFVGLHPKPPLPDQSALGRDAELYAAALMLRDRLGPAIVAGDLNATPWEEAVRRMQRVASLSDPRYGHGYVASWNAKRWTTRWPLDQIFTRGGFSVVSLERLDAFGSDHFPYVVRLCPAPTTDAPSPAPVSPGDRRTVEQAFAEAGAVIKAP